jgi:hypothetical protein
MAGWVGGLLVVSAVAGLGGCGGASTHGHGDLGDADMLGALACGDLVNCLNAAGTSDTAQDACTTRANSRAATLAQALFDCINGQCGPADAGTSSAGGDCGSEQQCVWCVQFGTSPTGGKHASCIDVDPATHHDPPTVSDPKCGLCVDQLNSCFSDSV